MPRHGQQDLAEFDRLSRQQKEELETQQSVGRYR